jgi:hypothetical protein
VEVQCQINVVIAVAAATTYLFCCLPGIRLIGRDKVRRDEARRESVVYRLLGMGEGFPMFFKRVVWRFLVPFLPFLEAQLPREFVVI